MYAYLTDERDVVPGRWVIYSSESNCDCPLYTFSSDLKMLWPVDEVEEGIDL